MFDVKVPYYVICMPPSCNVQSNSLQYLVSNMWQNVKLNAIKDVKVAHYMNAHLASNCPKCLVSNVWQIVEAIGPMICT